MHIKTFFFVFAYFLFCVHISHAQQYLFARYTPKDGLVNNRARFMYQDSKGRIYISTFGGLSIYDGSRFTNYTTANGLSASLVNDIVEMGDDSVWIIPNSTAIHCISHGIIRDIKTADNFYPVINQLIKCSDGYFYAIADQGLFRFEQNRFVKIPLSDKSGKDTFSYFVQALEFNKQLFIITDPNLIGEPGPGTLVIYNLDTRKLLVTDRSASAFFLAKSRAGEILLATRQGVRKIDLNTMQLHTVRLLSLPFPYQAADTIFSSYMYFDRFQNLWLSTAKELVKIDREGKKQFFNSGNVFPVNTINSIFQDRENNMWFTNEQSGIAKLVSQQVEFYSQLEPGATITDLYADGHSDSAWFYDDNRHSLSLIANNEHKTIQGIGNIPREGQIIIGERSYLTCRQGIYALHFLPGNTQFKVSLLYRDSTNGNGYASSTIDRRGNLVLTSAKLTVLLSGNIIQQDLHSLADQAAIDRYNRIWVITRLNELYVYRTDPSDISNPLQLLHTYSKELPKAGPRSIAVDNEGHVWIGTRDHGLFCLFFNGLQLVSWKQLTIKNGLSENFIYYLHCDGENTVWAGTPAGLDKIRFENGHFNIENSTHSTDNYQSINKIQSTGQGIHWVLSRGDIIKIKTSIEKQNTYLPHVLFSEVLAGNELVSNYQQHLFLPYDRNTISFHIGASSFIDETLTRYSYLLEGANEAQWTAPSTQSAINFVNLPPGKYTLHVKAQFLTGRYPDQFAAYPFFILPPWWQTWWFRAALMGATIGMAVLLIKYYVHRKLEKQRMALEKKQAIGKERSRIATDMHDDLGAGLSRIKFLSETIGIKKQQQLPFEDEILGIRQYSHEMIDKMGEIVWALNEKNDSLSDLLSYTRSYTVAYLTQAGIHCTVEAPSNFPSSFVSGEFRRNVYLTIKEALHNIVKHAKADIVFIHIEINEMLTITIKDEGIGFDESRIRPFSNGLNNMQKRIEEIGGILQILHESGTTVILSVPVPV